MINDNYYLLDDMEKYFPNFNRKEYENIPEEGLIIICRDYYENHLPVDVTTWCRVNNPDENLIYKKGQGEQICFVRDRIASLFYDNYKDTLLATQVISTHTSKSVLLPVMQLNVPEYGLEIVFRDNFHNWKISIKSKKEINCDFMDIFKEDDSPINPIYCEGFPVDKVYERYIDNKKQFTIQMHDDYKVYVFMYLLSKYIKNTGD